MKHLLFHCTNSLTPPLTLTHPPYSTTEIGRSGGCLSTHGVVLDLCSFGGEVQGPTHDPEG